MSSFPNVSPTDKHAVLAPLQIIRFSLRTLAVLCTQQRCSFVSEKPRGSRPSGGLRLTVAVAVLEPTGSGFSSSISAGRSLNAPTGSGLDLCASHGLYLDGRKIDTLGTRVFAFVNVIAARGEDRPGLIPIKLSKSDLDGLALENIRQPAELLNSPIWQTKGVPQVDAIYAKKVMPWIEDWRRHSLISAGVTPEPSAECK